MAKKLNRETIEAIKAMTWRTSGPNCPAIAGWLTALLRTSGASNQRWSYDRFGKPQIEFTLLDQTFVLAVERPVVRNPDTEG